MWWPKTGTIWGIHIHFCLFLYRVLVMSDLLPNLSLVVSQLSKKISLRLCACDISILRLTFNQWYIWQKITVSKNLCLKYIYDLMLWIKLHSKGAFTRPQILYNTCLSYNVCHRKPHQKQTLYDKNQLYATSYHLS